MINCGTFPALWNAAMASPNNTSAASASPCDVWRRPASRARKPSKNKSNEKLHSLLATDCDPLFPSCKRAPNIGFRKRHARDPECVADPVRISDAARDCDRFLDECERFLGASARLQTVDVRREGI